MKTFLTLVCLLLLQTAFAQNWEVIQPGVSSKFQGDWRYQLFINVDHNFVKSTINIFTDSIVTSGSEQYLYLRRDQEIASLSNVFYWGPAFYYVALNEPGRFGDIVIKSASGDYKFISHCGDTIVLKSKASVNQSWLFAPLNNGRYLEAKVLSIQVGSVLGALDSVKTIEIIAKDSLGQIMTSDQWNGKTFQLSKQHGLLSAPAFRIVNCTGNAYMYISDIIIYHLVSYKKNNQWLGKPDVKLDEIFNLQIGDVFHFNQSGYSTGGSGVYSYNTNGQSIEKLISKTYYPLGDSLHLIFDRFSVDSSQSIQQFIPYISVIRKHDTLIQTIQLNRFRHVVDALDSSSTDSSSVYFVSYDTSLNGRIKLALPKFGFSFWGNSIFRLSCSPNSSQGAGFGYIVVSKDLGVIQIREEHPSIVVMTSCNIASRSLAYFRRSGETWGTPFDTLAVLGIEGSEFSTEKIEVFPNPVKAGEWISLSSTHSGTIRFYNSIGTFMGSYDQNKFILAPETYGKGIYFWQFEGKNGQIKRGKLLVE
jgi:hypothetical protein